MRHYLNWRNSLFVIFALCLALSPLKLYAQEVNHSPLVSSQPTTMVSAGQTYQYAIEATDRNDDELSYSLTTAPDGMTMTNNQVSWQPTSAGMYNVVIQVSDQNSGYDTQAWQVIVTPGAISSIVISPNDKPTIVNLGDNLQFATENHDIFNNAISNAEITWSVEKNTGSISSSGLFNAMQGGIDTITATSGDASASVGIVVKDTQEDQVAVIEADETTPEDTTEEVTNTNTTLTTVATEEDQVTADSDEAISSVEETTTDSSEEENATDEACSNPANWIITIILIIYAIILFIYFGYEKKHHSAVWWVFPFLLTVIGLIIYYKYFCPSTYLWWPWVLVGIGIVITFYYKGRKNKTFDSDSQTELPF